jgi:hypothetical protein
MIAGLVRETILLRRAFDCEHVWASSDRPGEETCTRCTVSVTPEGKVELQRLADRFHRRFPVPSRP